VVSLVAQTADMNPLLSSLLPVVSPVSLKGSTAEMSVGVEQLSLPARIA
jgi:hypothetical protein